MCSAEQECHLTTAQVDEHHLDQHPGFKAKDKGSKICDATLELTLQECREARVALDSKADKVVKTNNASLPTGCYRQQQDKYRDRHGTSSYLWYFNEAANGQSDSKSEPVCKGKAKQSVVDYVCSRCIFVMLYILGFVKQE